MPRKAVGPEQQAMAGEVDRLLRQLNPEQARRPTPSHPGVATGPASAPTVTLPSPIGVWIRTALGAVLAGALTLWPYRFCGLALAGYLGASAVVAIAGVWAAHASWRRRMGIAHVVGISVVFVGLTLAALQLLPRLGYGAAAVPWGC